MVENQNVTQNSDQKSKKVKLRFFDGRLGEYLVGDLGTIHKSFVDYIIEKCDDQDELDKYYIYDGFDESFVPLTKYLKDYIIMCVEHDEKYSELDVIIAKCIDGKNECDIKILKFPKFE